MGLIDDIGKELLGNSLGGSAAGASSAQINRVQLAIDVLQRFGGIDGLTRKFTQKGLGDHIGSWVGTGRNLPVSGGQILAVLGRKNVTEIAKQTGIDANVVADSLAQALPTLIDKLTPKGEPRREDDLQQGISALLDGKMGDLSKLFG